MAKSIIAPIFRLLRAVAAVVVIASALFAARLTHSPIDLDFVKPTIERALSAAVGGADIRTGRLMLVAGGGRLAVSGIGVGAWGADGALMGRASRVDIDLDLGALLQGQIRPVSLDILNARLIAIREADGRLRLLAQGESMPGLDETPGMDIAGMARSWLAGALSLETFPDVKLTTAAFVARDASTGRTVWQGRADAGLTLSPQRALFWAEIDTDAVLEREDGDEAAPPAIAASATLSQGEGGDVSLEFNNANLHDFAELAAMLGQTMPRPTGSLDGRVRIDVGLDLEPQAATAVLTANDLRLDLGDAGFVVFEQAEIDIGVDVPARKVVVHGLTLGRNGVGLAAAGALSSDSNQAIAISGRVDRANLPYLAGAFGYAGLVAGIDANAVADFDVILKPDAAPIFETRLVINGRIERPDDLHDPIVIERAEAFLTVDGDRITAKGIDAHIEKVHLAGEIDVELDDDGKLETLQGRLLTDAFPFDQLARLWPKAFSPGGRAWVAKNLLKGQVVRADLELNKPAGGALDIRGDFDTEGVEVRYWDPLPLATNVSGSGRIVGSTILLQVAQAASAGLTSDDVLVSLIDLGGPTERIEIDGAIRGPTQNLLAVLDRKPLEYAKWLGVEPAATEGMIDGRLKLAFPLLGSLSIDDVKIAASGIAQNTKLPGVVNGWTLNAARLELDVDAERLRFKGAGELLDEPAQFAGDLFFGAKGDRARIDGEWRVSRQVRRAIGLGSSAFSRRFTGVAPAKFNVRATTENAYEIAFDADLTQATLLAQEIGWLKPKGQPAKVTGKAVLQGGAPIRIDDLALTAADMLLEAEIGFDPVTSALRSVAVKTLRGAGHDVFGLATLGDAGDTVQIRGPRIDLRPVLQLGDSADAEADTVEATGAPDRQPPLRIDMEVGEARLSENLRFSALRAVMTQADDRITSFDARATYPGGEMSVQQIVDVAGGYRLTATDFGKLVAAADITDGILGGKTVLTIRPTEDGSYALDATVGPFGLDRATVETLAGEGGAGIVTLFGGKKAIAFDRLEAAGAYANGRIRIERGVAQGGALGISARGDIDLRNDQLDIKGAIAPAYLITQVIGGIPLIGDILTGSRREGVFAANYRASGPMNDPVFKVDRLSALAPGILREALPAPGAPETEQSEEPGYND